MKNGFILAGLLAMAIAVALITSCEPSRGPPLLTECKWDQPIRVDVIVYSREEDLRRQLLKYDPDRRLRPNDKVAGFASYNPNNGLSTLHVLPIRGQRDHERVETLGEELAHAFCGEYHG